MKHEEANELLAALSLDAVEANERVAIEEHVATCPKCRSELDGLLEVAGALGNSVEPLPDGLWTSIASRLNGDGDDVHPMPVLAYDHGTKVPLTARRARSSWTRGAISSVGAVAAALIVVLGVGLAHQSSRVTKLQRQLDTQDDAAAALATPGHTVVDLASSTQRDLAQFVLVPDGRGYLVRSHLPALPASETYQLWGVINGKPISIAIMGATPRAVAFTVSGPKPSVIAITVEPAGGTPAPTSAMVASGTVED